MFRKDVHTGPASSPGFYRALVLLFFLFLVLGPTVPQWQAAAQPDEEPIAIGWGGSRLKENLIYTDPHDQSIVFPGELASDQERLARRLVDTGHNAIRVSFAPYCTDPDGFMGRYNSTQLARAFRIGETLGLWIIVDYHGYWEFSNATSANCWLGFWREVLIQFKDTYPRTIWEPQNELAGFSQNTTLIQHARTWYQKWIDQARSLGDEHWIVVQNICSYGCSLSNYTDGFPLVTDPLGRMFYSIHPYMPYRKYYSTWNNSTADSLALKYYSSMLNVTERTGIPVLNTEGGPGTVTRTINGNTEICPDLVLSGTSGYCKTNFHFVQALTNHLDSNQPRRIGWIWWPVGNWAQTPGAGILGSLALNGWGSRLMIEMAPTFTLEIDVNGGGTTFPGPGNHKFVTGAVVKIAATPPPENRVERWEVDGASQAGTSSMTVTMNADHTITVVFSPFRNVPYLSLLGSTSTVITLGAIALTVMIVGGVLLARRRRLRTDNQWGPEWQLAQPT